MAHISHVWIVCIIEETDIVKEEKTKTNQQQVV